tara:strand:- start:8592 stop:9008 length:417 start_codon:yes stop_codon:yes gene_type:complete
MKQENTILYLNTLQKHKRKERYHRIETKPQSRDYKLKMLSKSKDKARRRNVFFDLTLDDINVGKKCPILGTTFKVGKENWGDSPSLERIDKNRGYEPDNVIVVCMMANLIKNQATPYQIKQVGDFYEQLYRKKSINAS